MNKKITIPALLLCCIASGNAFAEKWYFEPTASLTGGYDDNVRLLANHEQSDYSSLLNFDMRFGARTEVSDTKFQVQLDSKRYADADLKDLESDDQKFGVDTNYRSGLNLFALTADYIDDSTSTSEEGTTGNIRTSKRRVLKSIAPIWQRQVTERSVLFASYNFTDVDYEEGSLTDYWNDSASFGVTHSLTEKTSVQVALATSRFVSDTLFSSEYKSNSVRIGLNHLLSETLTADMTVGFTRTDSDFQLGPIKKSVTDNSLQFDASLAKQFLTTTVKAGIVVSEIPSGEGRLLQTTALNLNIKHKISERLNLLLDMQVYKNETGGGITVASDEREYYSIRPMLQWRATEWWTVTTDYRYRQQEYTNTSRGGGVAESNAIFVTIRYVWPRENMGRWMGL